MQRSAEKAEGQERIRLLTEVWDEIRRLPVFGDYVADRNYYATYRDEYLGVITEMRFLWLTPE